MKIDHPYRICLHRSDGFGSSIVKAATRCQYSHGSYHYGGGWVIESLQGGGVQPRFISDWRGIDCLVHPGLSADAHRKAFELMMLERGHKYDWGAVLRFLGWQRDKDASNEKWFCFELLSYGLREGAGFTVAGGVKDCRIHGGHFEARIGDPLIRTPAPI